MIGAYKCSCGEYEFEVITENTLFTNNKDKTYFRCTECGEDYQWKDVNPTFNGIDPDSLVQGIESIDLNEKMVCWNKQIQRAEEYGFHFDVDSVKELFQTVEKLQKALEQINDTTVYYDSKGWDLSPQEIGSIATKALDR